MTTLILGGGVRPGGSIPPWVEARIDAALARWTGGPILCLSAGSVHVPALLDDRGQPWFESRCTAAELIRRGVPRESIYTETCSYDTIGNAYFTRLLHTDPRAWRDLTVVTSEFHMPRTRVIFDWVFALDATAYQLDYVAAPNRGLDAGALSARQAKERRGIELLTPLIARIQTMAALHDFIHTSHEAYAPGLQPSLAQPEQVLKTY
jgi:vancomycin permeability regulator SanA